METEFYGARGGRKSSIKGELFGIVIYSRKPLFSV